MSPPISTCSPGSEASLSPPNASDSGQSRSARSSRIAAPSCSSTGQTSATPVIFDPWMEDDSVELISSRQGFLASLLPLPASDEARWMTAGSGRRLCGFLVKRSQPSLCLRTLLESLLSREDWNSSVCFLRWKVTDTPFNRLLFRLAPSMPDTNETAFGLWPTPKTHEGNSPIRLRRKGGHYLRPSGKKAHLQLGQAVKLWSMREIDVDGRLNPTWVEWLMGYPTGWTALDASETPSSRRSRKSSSGGSGK